MNSFFIGSFPGQSDIWEKSVLYLNTHVFHCSGAPLPMAVLLEISALIARHGR